MYSLVHNIDKHPIPLTHPLPGSRASNTQNPNPPAIAFACANSKAEGTKAKDDVGIRVKTGLLQGIIIICECTPPIFPQYYILYRYTGGISSMGGKRNIHIKPYLLSFATRSLQQSDDAIMKIMYFCYFGALLPQTITYKPFKILRILQRHKR